MPPAEIVFDTSFVFEALSPAQPRHQACREFLTEVVRGSTVYFNDLLEVELWETAYKIAIRERHSGDWRKHRADGRIRRRAQRLQTELQQAWEEILNAVDWVSVSLVEVREWVPGLMAYGLSSNDAVHAATAGFADVNAIVALDFQFSCTPPKMYDLYVPAKRLLACRNQRGKVSPRS